MEIIKVFRVVEVDGYGQDSEVRHIAAYRTRKQAEDFLKTAKNNTYLSFKEDSAIVIGDKCYLLKRDTPIPLIA